MKKTKRISVTVPVTFEIAHVLGRWKHGGLYMTMGGGTITDDKGNEVGDIRCALNAQTVVGIKNGKETVILANNLLDTFDAVRKAVLKLELPADNPEPRE